MGDQNISESANELSLRHFMKALLTDVQALEAMLEGGQIESGVRRIGAEQEMFLVDHRMHPAPIATDILARIDDPRLTTELARFNLEANLTPRVFGGRCLSELEAELDEIVASVRDAARASGGDVLMTGILPTLRMKDLGLDNMTPRPRYFELNRAMQRLRGDAFRIVIKGIDELETVHDTVMFEACNTSFQVHFQVAPNEFARLYNIAQVVAAPVLAAAVNSPVLFGKRLWRETRVALFQRSIDDRSTVRQARGHRSRVSFGEAWIDKSVLEIYREDIARFRVLISAEIDEDPLEVLAKGGTPNLKALCMHNGTIYRWNRACYGVGNGKPHLRIENRVLPAGPTVIDEIANAAFFFGLMSAFTGEYEDVSKAMDFADAKANFFAAARHGLNAQFNWFGDKSFTAASLIVDHLLPQAEAALASQGIASEDIERYLGTIDKRVRANQTGSQWVLKSLMNMGEERTMDVRHRTVTSAMLECQRSGAPVHEWPLARLKGNEDWRPSYETVGQFMSTDLFTVRPEDLVDLVASVMDWRHIRHVPVEDADGRLVGLVSHRALLRLVGKGSREGPGDPVSVREIMTADPLTVSPDTPTLVALRKMRKAEVGCLPVVEDERLVGIVTERDFVEVSGRLLEEQLLKA